MCACMYACARACVNVHNHKFLTERDAQKASVSFTKTWIAPRATWRPRYRAVFLLIYL